MSPETWETLKTYLFPIIMGIVTLAIAFANTRKASAEAVQKAIENGQQNALFAQEQFKKVQERADDEARLRLEDSARITQLIERNGALKDELEQANAAHETTAKDLAVANAEIRTLIENLEKRVHENAELRKDFDNLKVEFNKLSRVNDELTELRAQFVTLNGQLKGQEADRHALLAAHEDERKRWQEREQQLKTQNDRLKKQVDELIVRVKHQDEKIARLENIEAENRELRAEVERLKTAPAPLPVGTLMFEDVKHADGSTTIEPQVMETLPPLPAGETTTDNTQGEQTA